MANGTSWEPTHLKDNRAVWIAAFEDDRYERTDGR